MRLVETLKNIKAKSLTSFFMPGHKMGRHIASHFPLDYAFDITEIAGADYLHHPTGTILETEEHLSKRYGSEMSKILVNGSTVGILSMIMGLVGEGETLLLNRNAHKSVYHAIEMGNILPAYFFPIIHPVLEIPMGLSIDAFETFLEDHSDAKACLITYPTYEGICYPIEEIIERCHEKGIVVLVDEAHGAHLHLSDVWPNSSLAYGADIVVQSFHKTLPALTQTAGIHFGKNNILKETQKNKIMWYLSVLQTSSPSYLLMGSVDAMLTVLDESGKSLADTLQESIKAFAHQVKKLQYIVCETFEGMDPTKIILRVKDSSCTGHWLAEQLREKHVEIEYATSTMCLLMTSISSHECDFEQLIKALEAIEVLLAVREAEDIGIKVPHEVERLCDKDPSCGVFARTDANAYDIVYSPCEAKKRPMETCTLEEAIGRVSLSYLIPYPPGIPIVVPGERITQIVYGQIKRYEGQLMQDLKEGINVEYRSE